MEDNKKKKRDLGTRYHEFDIVANLHKEEQEPIKRVKSGLYIFQDGLRKVKPYYYDFTTDTKKRWIGTKVVDMYLKEFPYYSREYLEKAIELGRITFNDKKITKDAILPEKTVKLKHKVHRHEAPVLDEEIEIIWNTKNILVISKPPSIPVHPCGRYRLNSILEILSNEYNLKNLFPVYRLDTMTSGVLLIAKSKKLAKRLTDQMVEKNISKIYIARVKGNFPLGQVISVDEKINVKNQRLGIWGIDNVAGKDALTKFYGVAYHQESDTSLVLCKPITGRTHQIRIHLQHLSHPIPNDPLYGPNAKEDGDVLIGEKRKISETIIASLDEPPEKKSKLENDVNDNENFDPLCTECAISKNGDNVDPKTLFIYLHAWRYKGPQWEFVTKLPKWCIFDENVINQALLEFEKKL